MKLTLGLVCLIMAIAVKGAPQAGPVLGLPWDSYAPECRPPPCPPTGKVNVSFPLDCLQYVECNDGVAKTRPCPDDLFWHKAAGKCDERKIANCKQCW